MSPSPDGSYKVAVSSDGPYWIFAFYDAKGNPMTEDETDFSSLLKVYWCWDKGNRLWVYNSDDGWTWYWSCDGSQWTRTPYSTSDISPDPALTPPEALYPEYVPKVPSGPR